eukprot:m51a1_g5599 hypothetical protein (264) ;mRNA; f:677872-689834
MLKNFIQLDDTIVLLVSALLPWQQDQIIKGLEAARAKLKEKIAMYKKEQVRVTNELHEQHVLVATLKSQNEGLKEQLELLKSEHANWREYEFLKGTSTTPSKHKAKWWKLLLNVMGRRQLEQLQEICPEQAKDSESDEEQRRALQEKQQISALMKMSRDLLAIFTAEPSKKRAHQPCTFGEVRTGFKAMQMLLAGTLSDLIMRMNALTCAVEAGVQSRELMLRKKLMLGIPVPELENLPADRGLYITALSVIMARPIISQIEQ